MFSFLKRKSGTKNRSHTQPKTTKPPSKKDLYVLFVTHVNAQDWANAESTYRDLINDDPKSFFSLDLVHQRIKDDNIVINNSTLLRKIYGADYYLKAHKHLDQIMNDDSKINVTELDSQVLCQKLRKESTNQQIIHQLLALWDLPKHNEKKLSNKWVLSLANNDICELFFGIGFLKRIDGIHTSDIFDAINILIRDRNNQTSIIYLCDLILQRGYYKIGILDYNHKINQILDSIIFWSPFLENYIILNQKLGIKMNEKCEVQSLMQTSRKLNDYSLVNHLLENEFHFFQQNLNWLDSNSTYGNRKLFNYFPDFINLCHRTWGFKSMKDTQLNLWELLCSAGNLETLEYFAPLLQESNQFSGYVKNNKTLLFLADQSKHQLDVQWAKIESDNSYVKLWLHKNRNVLLNFEESKKTYNIASSVPHAIKHSNYEFFTVLQVPIMDVIVDRLNRMGTSNLATIKTERMIAFLTFLEGRKENCEYLVKHLILREDLDEILTYLLSGIFPKVEPKIEYLFKALNNDQFKCSKYLMMMFKDQMPSRIHHHIIRDHRKINKYCKELNLPFRYKAPSSNGYELIKVSTKEFGNDD